MLEKDGLGVMISIRDDFDFASGEGRRSSDSTPAVSDPDVEMTEHSDAIDLRGPFVFWYRSGNRNLSSKFDKRE